MATQTQIEPPSPVRIFETLQGYQRTAALKAAIELDLFTAIGDDAQTAAALAKKCGTAERGVRILCDYLAVMGFLLKQGGAYRLSEDAAMYLNQRSPAYMGSAVRFLLAPAITEGVEKLTDGVRKGGTAVSEEGTMEPDHPVWVEFARAMAPLMALPAELIARLVGAASGQRWKVLDIAAGHGLFGVAIARHNPNAQVTAVDWRNVLAVAKENAKAAGVESRYSTIEGSAFDVEYGAGYDMVLITNFLHHFDPPTNEQLLRKIRAARPPGASAVTLEFVPDDDRVNPPVAAQFALQMLAGTRAGDAYTFKELERMFANAGFSRSEMHELPPSFQRVVISHA
jgi:ubiquinone/menaquinone biosynthesis C-methylase UbiE